MQIINSLLKKDSNMIWPDVHHEMYLLVQHQVQLDELFRGHLGINECTSKCNTGATQVEPKVHPYVQSQVNLLVYLNVDFQVHP